MKIGILASETSWYYRDIERAAGGLGHHCERLDFTRLVSRCFSLHYDISVSSSESLSRIVAKVELPQFPSTVSPFQKNTPSASSTDATRFDVILVRTMPPGSLEQVVFRMDLLAQLEAAGTYVINPPKSLECAVDKYLTTARVQRAGLPVPDTIVCEHEDDAMEAFVQLGSDVVVKPLFGSEGRGIVRVSDPDLAHRTFRTLMRLDSVLYLQKFVNHAGFDVRVLILNKRVVGAIRRHSPHDFRTNVSRQAIAQHHEPTAQEIDYALRATACTGAFIAGVDLLYDRDGRCYVIEVNAVPGWQAFSRVTGIDVAASLITEIIRE